MGASGLNAEKSWLNEFKEKICSERIQRRNKLHKKLYTMKNKEVDVSASHGGVK